MKRTVLFLTRTVIILAAAACLIPEVVMGAPFNGLTLAGLLLAAVFLYITYLRTERQQP